MTDEPTLIERLRKPSGIGEPMDHQAMAEAADELAGWERSFDLYWRANQRAVALWHQAHPPQEAVLARPDQGKMIEWLCETIEKLRQGGDQ
jgi:hypothetical protein